MNLTLARAFEACHSVTVIENVFAVQEYEEGSERSRIVSRLYWEFALEGMLGSGMIA